MNIFNTNKKTSLYHYIYGKMINLFPCFRRTGGRVIFLSSDWKEIHIKIPKNWKTRNYVGSIFGGSIMAASDPFYMLQLIKLLGDKYIVWDKTTHTTFIKPALKTIYAKFLITDENIEEIKKNVALSNKYYMTFDINFIDTESTIYATINKTLYISTKEYYNAKKNMTKK